MNAEEKAMWMFFVAGLLIGNIPGMIKINGKNCTAEDLGSKILSKCLGEK